MSEMDDDEPQGARRLLRNLWLNPRYQSKYLFWMTISSLIMLVLQLLVFWYFTKEGSTTFANSPLVPVEYRLEYQNTLWQVFGILLSIGGLFILSVSAIGLVFSHRIVGPWYRFKKVCNSIKNGDRGARVYLREYDDFQEVAAAFNEMMDTIHPKS